MIKKIWVNEPSIWTFENTGENNLIEPMIENFQKFNSNTGWFPNQKSPWIEVMQGNATLTSSIKSLLLSFIRRINFIV